MLAPAAGAADQMSAPHTVISPAPTRIPRGIHVTTGLPHLRLRLSAALALSLLAALPVLPAIAQGHRTACASSGHARHGAHACAVHSRKGRPHADKRHHSGHGAARLLPAATKAPTGTAGGRSAICEDAAAPLSAGKGSPSCAPASERACAEGSSPTPAGAGEAAPPCAVSSEPDTGGDETTCEDAAGNPCEPPEEAGGSPCDETSPAAPSGEGPTFICEG
ncbi:MAG: hypothetical protein JWN81_2523 [Solirubrobacterales bacterium]|nr:hypothetical protein [Solirubrobacterales bacterium]